jgi:hypothetical protein
VNTRQHYAWIKAQHAAKKARQKKQATPRFVSSPAFEREGTAATKRLLGKDYLWLSELFSRH